MIFSLTPAPDGTTRTFTVCALGITTPAAYRAGTAQVILNGRIFPRDDATWGLTEPSATTVTLTTAPAPGDVVQLSAEPSGAVVVPITQPGARLPPEVRLGNGAAILREWCMVDGQNVVPTGTPNLTILKPGGEPTSVSNAAVTMSGTQMTYTLNASDTAAWNLGRGYILQWSYDFAGENYVREEQFDIVRKCFLPFIPITMDDLKNADPQINALLSQAGISATAYQRYLIPAWEEVYRWVRSHDRRPFCISDSRILAPVTKYKALELLCRATHLKADDRWDKLALTYRGEYETAQAQTVLEYDESEARQYQRDPAFVQPQVSSGPINSSTAGTADWRRRIGTRP